MKGELTNISSCRPLSSAPVFLCLWPTSLFPRERRGAAPFPQGSGTWAEARGRCFRPFFFAPITTRRLDEFCQRSAGLVVRLAPSPADLHRSMARGLRWMADHSSASTAPHIAHARTNVEGGHRPQTAGVRPGAGRPCPELKVCGQSGGNEARAHRIEVLVAAARLVMHVEALRNEQHQPILRSRHGHVEQAPFLLDL